MIASTSKVPIGKPFPLPNDRSSHRFHVGPVLKFVKTILAIVSVLGSPQFAFAQTTNERQELAEARQLNQQGVALSESGKYAEAGQVLRRALATREKFLGAWNPDIADSLNNLGLLYLATGKYGGTEALFKRAIEIWAKAYGPNHADVAAGLNNLALLYKREGRHETAEASYLRAVAMVKNNLGENHPTFVRTLGNLGVFYTEQSQFERAEPLLKQVLTLSEKLFRPDHPDLATGLTNLAVLHIGQGQYRQAEPLLQRAVKILENTRGRDHPDLAKTLNNLAGLYKDQGLYGRAEPLYQRALRVAEQTFGPEHLDVALYLANLAVLYHLERLHGRAELLYKKALSIRSQAFGAESIKIVPTLINLAALYEDRLLAGGLRKDDRSFNGIAALYKRALSIQQKTLGLEHLQVATTLKGLARLYKLWQQYDQAIPLYKQALSIEQNILGSDHAHLAMTLGNLADIYHLTKQYAAAEPLYQQSLRIQAKSYGLAHPFVAIGAENLAANYLRQRNLSAARHYFEQMRRMRLAVVKSNADLDEISTRGLQQEGQLGLRFYATLLALMGRQTSVAAEKDSALRDGFVAAEQMKHSLAHSAILNASLRSSPSDPEVAQLIRKIQDLRTRRRTQTRDLVLDYTKPIDKRDEPAMRMRQRNEQQLDAELTNLTANLAKVYPPYHEIADPTPVDLAAVKNLLEDREALISFMRVRDVGERLLIWLVKKDQEPVYRDVEIQGNHLKELVAKVRASLDQNKNPYLTTAFKIAPFDVSGAFELHKLLFAPLKDHLGGIDKLIIVPDELLLPLPFGALVTGAQGESFAQLAAVYDKGEPLFAPDETLLHYAKLAWLANDYSITVLPSATSLRALRQRPRPKSQQTETLLAFGDPLLDGQGLVRGGSMLPTRGTAVAVEELRKLNRLPGTRAELETIAKSLGAPASSLFLGESATKAMVNELNNNGRFARAQVVAFSTHGLISGEIKGLREPALVLTPPAAPTEEDNGLLALEDILKLKLDSADWVVLSACNTAAADGSGEGLSGLTRAFFFAGARSLLVSHWSVEDQATQTLMAEIFQHYAANKDMSRAEVLRRGMLSMAAKAKAETAYFAHPFAWAPFFIVGDR